MNNNKMALLIVMKSDWPAYDGQNICPMSFQVGYGYNRGKGQEQAIKLACIRSKQSQEVEEGTRVTALWSTSADRQERGVVGAHPD